MSKQIRKNRYQKHLRIAVKFDGSKFVLLNGSPLPGIQKDTVGELLIRTDAILDPAARAQLTRDILVEILPAGSTVLLGVSPHLLGAKTDGLIRDARPLKLNSEYWLVEVRLEDTLRLRIRGDQEAKLEACKCMIPALQRNARSINHAFTIISEAYEVQRLSHTGNVFQRAYTFIEPGGWKTLEDLRLAAIAKLQHRANAASS